MKREDIHIYGGGLSGLICAINLARNGFDITVFEKEKRIGGSKKCHPSIHMTPINIEKMEKYIGINIKSCFSKLEIFNGYIDNKKFSFSTKNLFVVERGPRELSLDFYLYSLAIKEGVKFKFSHPLKKEKLSEIPDNSIISTAGYSQLGNSLKIPFITFKQYDTHMKADLGNITKAYFGNYSSDYGYISGKNGIISAQLSGSSKLSLKDVNRFIQLVKETENIELKNWSSILSYFPKKVQLFKKFFGKTFILTGDIAGFLDPYFGFGINGALISGKIASLCFTSRKKALNEFNKYKSNLNKNLLFHTVYWHLPFKNYIRKKVLKIQDKHILSINNSIPGFAEEDWLKIV
jgi:flavin-dependent dehydrogenase